MPSTFSRLSSNHLFCCCKSTWTCEVPHKLKPVDCPYQFSHSCWQGLFITFFGCPCNSRPGPRCGKAWPGIHAESESKLLKNKNSREPLFNLRSVPGPQPATERLTEAGSLGSKLAYACMVSVSWQEHIHAQKASCICEGSLTRGIHLPCHYLTTRLPPWLEGAPLGLSISEK